MHRLHFPHDVDADPWTGLDSNRDVFDAIREEIGQRAEDHAPHLTPADLDEAARDALGQVWPCGGRFVLPGGSHAVLECTD